MHTEDLQRKAFLALLVAVTVAFLWVIFPVFGAVLWAVTFAILFRPLQRSLRSSMRLPPAVAAALTTLLVLLLVILPAVVVSGFVVEEAAALVQKLRSGEIDLTALYRRMLGALPSWATRTLEGAGLGDLSSLQDRIKQTAADGSQPIARRLWTMGQGTLDFAVNFFVMLYLLFFLLRDGPELLKRVGRAVPLEPTVQQRLAKNFSTVVRSTVKGNVVVALIQGALGGIALLVLGIPGAVLWAVVMAFLSLLPAVGAALVWGPIAIYLLSTGQVAQGIGLIAFGTLVIGLVDNVLRPILVGKETRMPDWVVLISTIGGMSLFGINGFVIGPVLAALFIAVWDLTTDDSTARPQPDP
ncbi:AI-2E family transporter [Piscinibacter sp. HJYY11]|uniref:AI-2E family transporter n=1 Tax=Piscinibacter sp. HJYY11 TaxID=2801333 RepID=UPI00191E4DDB|nr:AI-2E family transporter [Piscinibacter sp. HJYY11]MBL0726482.1 AI-2E family transporter [Piscinibacter sp. HJYY11]